MATSKPQDTVIEVEGPHSKLMERKAEEMKLDDSSTKFNSPPTNYLAVSAISVLFCPLVGLLAVVMSLLSTQWFVAGKKKRAHDAAWNAKFSAIFAIAGGIAIGFFFLFLYVIVPHFA